MARVVVSVVLAVALGLVAAAGGRPQAQAPAPRDGFIVRLRPGAVTPAGCAPIYGQADRCVMRGTSATAVEALRADGNIVEVEDNYVVSLDPVRVGGGRGVGVDGVNDPLARDQWHLAKIDATSAWWATDGAGALIAVVDTGVDCDHPDLTANCISRGRDFISGRPDGRDDHGHGTHVAGIAAAVGNNAQGGAGVAYGASILPVKALAASGSGDHASIASGIAWAADQGVKVINMSFGGQYSSATLENAVNYAWSKGVVMTCAAGNSASVVEHFPAAYARCVGVAATDPNDRRAGFSNWGSWVRVAAPGVDIWSTTMGGGFQPWQGTSMAAPVVAGVAALVSAAHPDWSAGQVVRAIEDTTDAVQEIREIAQHGRVNAGRALSGGTGGPATPTPSVADRCVNDDPVIVLECRLNVSRALSGVSPLRGSWGLRATAGAHAGIVRSTGCTRQDCPGEPPLAERMRQAGLKPEVAEQALGVGWSSPKEMLAAWLASPAAAVVLDPRLTHMGCAWLPAVIGASTVAVCDFARMAEDFSPSPTPTRVGGLPTPSATSTALPRPPMPTPSPLRTATPTATPTPGAVVWYRITVFRNAGSLARQLGSWLCGLGDPGVRCE